MPSPLPTIAAAYLAWVGLVGVRWYVQARVIAAGRSSLLISYVALAVGLVPYALAAALALAFPPEAYSSLGPRRALLELATLLAPTLLLAAAAAVSLRRVMLVRVGRLGDLPGLQTRWPVRLYSLLTWWLLMTLGCLIIHEWLWLSVGLFSYAFFALAVLLATTGRWFWARTMGVTLHDAVAMEESPLREEIDAIQRAFFRRPRPVEYRGMRRGENAESESVLLAGAYSGILRVGIRRRVALASSLVRHLEPAELTLLVALGLAVRNFPRRFLRSRPVVTVAAIAAAIGLPVTVVEYVYTHHVPASLWVYYYASLIGAQAAALVALILGFSVARARRAIDHAFAAWRDADPTARRTVHDFLRTLVAVHHRCTGLDRPRVIELFRTNPRVRGLLARHDLDPDAVMRGLEAENGGGEVAAAGGR